MNTEIRFTLYGEPASKKNSSRICNRPNGVPFLMPNAKYKQYEKDVIAQVPRMARQLIDYPVNVCAVYYRKTRRHIDKTNCENALLDVLVKAGGLLDDNRDIVAFTDGSCVMYDKENPRTEVVITELEREYEQWHRY